MEEGKRKKKKENMKLNRLNRLRFLSSDLDEARSYLRDGVLPSRLGPSSSSSEADQGLSKFVSRWEGFSVREDGEVYYESRRVVPREQLHEVLAKLYSDPRVGANSRDRLFERTSQDYVGISRRAIMDWLRNQRTFGS